MNERTIWFVGCIALGLWGLYWGYWAGREAERHDKKGGDDE